MTFDVSAEVLAGACIFMGGQIAILAQVVRSNRDQGRRLGAIEKREGKREGAREERQRSFSRANGIPISDSDSDETPP